MSNKKYVRVKLKKDYYNYSWFTEFDWLAKVRDNWRKYHILKDRKLIKKIKHIIVSIVS